MSQSLVKVTDYGLGTYDGEPLVLFCGGECYHRHDHGGRLLGQTFTEPFMRDDWPFRPCKVCFPQSPPSPQN